MSKIDTPRKPAEEKLRPDAVELLEQLNSRIDELLHLQRIGLLKDNVIRFPYNDVEIALYVPWAERDFIQKNIVRYGRFYESNLLEKLRTDVELPPRPVMLDVGANIGNHTVFFGAVMNASRIVAVEPQNTVRAILQRNLELNGLESLVTTVSSLVGSSEGQASIKDYPLKNSGGTSFSEDGEGDYDMTTLDAICAKLDNRVDFAKIDVEGMHVEVLGGADRMLSEIRPKIWMELRSFKAEFDEAEAILKKYDYVHSSKLGAHDHIFVPVDG